MANKKNGSTFATFWNKFNQTALRVDMKKSLFKISLLVLGLWLALASCRKENNFNTVNASLRFDNDTIFLDTVFTSIGSSTRILKVFNPTDENIYINRVYLGRGQSSYFRMNVNGTSGKNLTDVELPANDSIYVFIEVTADVLGANSLLYTDSIIFETGNVRQDVDLVTLAKDAYFHYPTDVLQVDLGNSVIEIPYSILPPNEVWGADKPHVIYGYVFVDSDNTLEILPGAEIHFHSNSGLYVYEKGKLLIDKDELGDMNNPIIIQGDRLEPWHENVPGQWGGLFGGIYISLGSEGNIINNAIIKNSTIAIRTDSTSNPTTNLALKNVQLLNNSRAGLYAGYSNIDAENVIISNSGIYLFYALGGTYSFRHCTFGNYWTGSSRNTPAVAMTNFFEDAFGNIKTRDVNKAYFGNCIVYGTSFNEVGLGIEASATFNYLFKNSLLKIDDDPDSKHYDINDPTYFDGCLFNSDPAFINPQNNDFALDSISPALNIGNMNDALLVPFDIFGTSRTVNPDLGAIER